MTTRVFTEVQTGSQKEGNQQPVSCQAFLGGLLLREGVTLLINMHETIKPTRIMATTATV